MKYEVLVTMHYRCEVEAENKSEAQIKATEEARTFCEIYGWWDYDIEELEDD